ncbi:hypothetical protein D9M68_798180 [compost metagenome]
MPNTSTFNPSCCNASNSTRNSAPLSRAEYRRSPRSTSGRVAASSGQARLPGSWLPWARAKIDQHSRSIRIAACIN